MVRIGLLLLVLSLAAFAQEFEVASIRPSSQNGQTQGMKVDGSMVRCSAPTLKVYLQMAHRLKPYQIVAPDWMNTIRWDITAKLPEGSDPKQIPEMMQALLVDRFQMKMHRETREVPVYGLVIGKSGLNMKESPLDQAGNGHENSVRSGTSVSSGAGGTTTYDNGGYFTEGNNRLEGKKLRVDLIAGLLSRFSDRPVVDMTGLKGNYDFSMEFSPEDFARCSSGAREADTNGAGWVYNNSLQKPKRKFRLTSGKFRLVWPRFSSPSALEDKAQSSLARLGSPGGAPNSNA
jgi:uncharacterized protein (TIGR03435 family)